MAQYKIYELDNGEVLIADGGGYYPGIYDSAETAVAVVRACESDAQIENLFGPIYWTGEGNRRVTMRDVEAKFGKA